LNLINIYRRTINQMCLLENIYFGTHSFDDIHIAFLFSLFFILLVKERYKAGILSIGSLILFFSHQAFSQMLAKFSVGQWLLAHDPSLYLTYFLILVGAIYFLKKSLKDFSKLSYLLNLCTFILVLFPSFNLIYFNLNIAQISESLMYKKKQIVLHESKNKKKPDIYYIILDAYAREDILKDFYNFDNSDFIHFLKKNGFYIGNKSRSNYPATGPSLSSTFNMDFVATNGHSMAAEKNYLWPLFEGQENNVVIESLKSHGYKYIHFNSDFGFTDHNKNADLLITPPYWISGFFVGIANKTILKTFNLDILNVLKKRQKSILYSFDKLKEIPQDRAPTFTFAHIMMPHWPIVFDKNGNTPKGSNGKGLNGYLEFLSFANLKAKSLIKDLISQSEIQPIIILQSDHGTEQLGRCIEPNELLVKERMAILNAFLVPNEVQEGLYESITSINTFRVLFNRYFGTKLKILEDKVFFTYCGSSVYQPVRVPDEEYLPTDSKNVGSNAEWIKSLEDTISQFPDNVFVLNTLGAEYLVSRDFQKAEKSLKLALEFKNRKIGHLIYKNLGNVFREQTRYSEAAEAYKKSLDIEPNNVETTFLLAEVYVAGGKYQKAQPYLDWLSLMNPRWGKLHRLRANVYSATGDTENAIKEYRNVLTFKFQDLDIHLKISSLYDEVKNGRKAIFHNIIAGQLLAGIGEIDNAKKVEKEIEKLLAKYNFQTNDFSHVRIDQIPSKEMN
jgi:tetratricopeptide (TPR) repeat protein